MLFYAVIRSCTGGTAVYEVVELVLQFIDSLSQVLCYIQHEVFNFLFYSGDQCKRVILTGPIAPGSDNVLLRCVSIQTHDNIGILVSFPWNIVVP